MDSTERLLSAIEELREESRERGRRTEEHLAKIDSQLAYHSRQIASMYEQAQAHGAMLLEHARLHTQHARAIIAAKESAREAMQSSTDLAREWREAAAAIDRHVKASQTALSLKIDDLLLANQQAEDRRTEEREAEIERRERAAIDEKKRADELALQTTLLRQLVGWKDSVWFRRAVGAGLFVGGVIAGVVAGLAAHGVIHLPIP